jgi:hypothetical protein
VRVKCTLHCHSSIFCLPMSISYQHLFDQHNKLVKRYRAQCWLPCCSWHWVLLALCSHGPSWMLTLGRACLQ